MKLKRILTIPILLLVAGTGLAACGSGSDTVQVNDAWVRTTAPGQPTSAIYMKIKGGSDADRLVGVSVPATVAGRAELHESTSGHESGPTGADSGHDAETGGMAEHDDGAEAGDGHGMESDTGATGHGTMTMRQVHGIDVPAGGEVALEPGGFHVMLFELKGPLKAGDTVPVTLDFRQAGEVAIDAEVREG